MNSFGRLFRISLLGESHGEVVGVLIDGCPAGLPLKPADFTEELDRRRGGLQKATTPRKEDDIPKLITGVFNGFTTGAPLTILFENKNVRSEDYEKLRETPRPGHADLVATIKAGGYEDYRGGGHYSGRLTVALVAAGVVAKRVVERGPGGEVRITATILEIAGEPDIEKGIQKAIEAKDSVGGIIECSVSGLPAGLGEPFFDSVESVISHLVFSIPAVKAIEFGAGFGAAKMFGSEHNDAFIDREGRTQTNNAGGVLAGLTNGNELLFRIAVKPTSSTPKEQHSINLASGEMEKMTVKGRHDLCIALRVPVVLEAVTAIALADLLMLEQRIARRL
jgi:chorismate synthase